MYIIFSQKTDMQSNTIIDSLLSYGKDVHRINDEFSDSEKNKIKEKLKRIDLHLDSKKSSAKNSLSIFFRRPAPTIIKQLLDYDISEDDIIHPQFQKGSSYFKQLKHNYLGHQEKFYENLLSDPRYCICKIDYRLNKIDVLRKAKKIGLDIPDTLVTGQKKRVSAFLKKNKGEVITKSIYEIIPKISETENFWIKTYTQKVENIDDMPEQFFPTLFQKNIEKKFEIRIFYLLGECYSAAIMSQKNAETIIDFRNSNNDIENRIVPYNINAKLKSKIVKLMKVVDLNTGSLDFMIGTNGKTYFLEINPVGQFGWIDSACNLDISDEIAKKMILNHDK